MCGCDGYGVIISADELRRWWSDLSGFLDVHKTQLNLKNGGHEKSWFDLELYPLQAEPTAQNHWNIIECTLR